jgi:hypothetical protein
VVEYRRQFLLALEKSDSNEQLRGREKDYFRGRLSTGVTAPEHQLKLELREFGEPK